MHFFKHAVGEHPLVSAYDEAVSALSRAWDRFNNCSQNEVDQAIFALKVAEGEVDRIIREAKEQGVKVTSIKTRFGYYSIS